MLVAFNIAVIVLTLLIAYWWANQGLFSAIIHLLCVVVAGALSLALWEPLTLGLMLRGSAFDPYAWGTSLVVLFAVILFVLRLATNKLVPANVAIPHWADLAFGFPVGAAAGVLTIGILLIGAGHVQSQREIMGFVGDARRTRDGQVARVHALWLPCHEIAGAFYEGLSIGALRPGLGGPVLLHYNPGIARQGAGLLRDSYDAGRGQVALPPSAAQVIGTWVCSECRAAAVRVRFGRGSMDFGVQLTLSSSQVRLVAWPGSSRTAPYVAHPARWAQEVKDRGVETFDFDDLSHYATSVPGREQAEITFEFSPWPEGQQPRFIQIKGTRFELRQPQALSRAQYQQQVLSGRAAAGAAAPVTLAGGGGPIDAAIKVSNDISPVSVSTNAMPGGMNHRDGFLYEGDAVFKKAGPGMISRQLRVKGIEEPPGTRIVQVDISRNESPADVFGAIEERAGRGATPTLVDDGGNTYSPIGFIHVNPDGVRIRIDPSRGIRSMEDLPRLPTAGGQELRLLFRVTGGVTLVGLRLGDVTVGSCDVLVEGR
jgi:hypothetical protein